MKRLLLIGCVLAAAVAGWQAEPAVEFIHLTDTHVLNLDGVAEPLVLARDHFDPSAKNLADYFDAFANEAARPYRPAFFLITGDLIDAFRYAGESGGRVGGQVEAFRRAAAHSPVPVYSALGNHDIMDLEVAGDKPAPNQASAAEARAAWKSSEPCFRNGTYYGFDRKAGKTTYRLLVLDNGYKSGEPGGGQLRWLEREARGQGSRVLVLAMHVPLAGDDASRATKAALGAARVALVLAGHNHVNGIEEIALGAGKAVQVRTAAFGYGVSNWRRIRL
jgi:hypothetical protein